jgi:uncharacterized repeat protein (TIGR01451 family)
MNSSRVTRFAALILFATLGKPAYLAAVDFATAKSYPVGTSPAGIAVADFNGDSKLDIAVANTGSSNVSILLGNGDGTFQPAVNFSAGNNPSAIAVGDFNGDGKLDLAVLQRGANGVAGSVSILLGNGDGTFQAPKTMTLSPSAYSLAVADFNLDKKSDLAVCDFTSLGIFIGNGDGTFQPVKQTTLSSGCFGFVTADFNSDSKPDVALVTRVGIQILLGNGDGTFSQGGTVTVTKVSPQYSLEYESVVAIDLNRDAKVDLIVSTIQIVSCGPIPPCSLIYTKISAFLGNGDGSFQAEQIVASATAPGNHGLGSEISHPFVGDFNGDGKLDLAYRNIPAPRSLSPSLQIRLGNGDGSFGSPISSGLENVNPFAGSITVAQDLNADKLTDLIAIGTANDIDVLLNTSPASGADLVLHSSGASPQPVGIGRSLTYTAQAGNQGPQDATGVKFTDTLPNNVSFVSASISQGNCVQSNGIVSCNVGSLASPFDFTANIVVIATTAGTGTNTMNVTANETDPIPANNSATQTTTVVPLFKLTVTGAGNGSGTVTLPDDVNGPVNCASTCSATYLSGTMFTVVETADANSVFAGWSGACTGTGACTLTIDANKSLTANFALGEKLSVALAGSGSGSVTSKDGGINCANGGGTCTSLYLPGTSVSLTAAPAGTSAFGGWSGACTGSDPNVCSVTMNSVQSVTVTFNSQAPDFNLTPASAALTTQTGAQVTDTLTLSGQNGFSGPVTLTCAVTGPSPLPTCGVSPSPVTVGPSGGTAKLTMTAPTTLGAFALPLKQGSHNAVYALVLPIPGLLLGGMGLASLNFKKRRRALLVLGGSGVILLFAIFAGCGGGTTHTPQNFAVTVTAANASGSIHHSTTVTLTVQ